MSITEQDIARMIDHSLLHPTLTDRELEQGCLLAKDYRVASVCIKPYALAMGKEILKDSEVKLGTVIGFPHGSSTIGMKETETKRACRDGAAEIDMVINIGKAISGDWQYIEREIATIKDITDSKGAILKVIFENAYLNLEQIKRLCDICNRVKPAFIKTSTGYGFVKQENGCFNSIGATIPHLEWMAGHCSEGIQIKAAGGVRSLKSTLLVRSLGVTRIGATVTAKIVNEARDRIARGENLEKLAEISDGLGSGY